MLGYPFVTEQLIGNKYTTNLGRGKAFSRVEQVQEKPLTYTKNPRQLERSFQKMLSASETETKGWSWAG
jgi:hypothetical protein